MNCNKKQKRYLQTKTLKNWYSNSVKNILCSVHNIYMDNIQNESLWILYLGAKIASFNLFINIKSTILNVIYYLTILFRAFSFRKPLVLLHSNVTGWSLEQNECYKFLLMSWFIMLIVEYFIVHCKDSLTTCWAFPWVPLQLSLGEERMRNICKELTFTIVWILNCILCYSVKATFCNSISFSVLVELT